MRVLVISTNTLPASPSGPAYVAGAVRAAGHEVQVYERLFAGDLEAELASLLEDWQPGVVGISIRLVFGDTLDLDADLGTRHTDLRPRVREIVEIVRRHSPARIVLGGPGFNYYARDWLDYLAVDYGIRGEGEESFPLFLDRLAEGGDICSGPGNRLAGPAGSSGLFPRVRSRSWIGPPCRLMIFLILGGMPSAASRRPSSPSVGAPVRARIARIASLKANATG